MPLYNSNLQMTQAVHAWLASKPETFFFCEGVQKIVAWWTNCIGKNKKNMLKNDAIVHTQPHILHTS